MTIEVVRDFFGWCTVINFGFLLYWFVWLWLAHDWVYRLHHRWFNLSVERFDAINYTVIAVFKILVIVFNLVPYFALRIVG